MPRVEEAQQLREEAKRLLEEAQSLDEELRAMCESIQPLLKGAPSQEQQQNEPQE